MLIIIQVLLKATVGNNAKCHGGLNRSKFRLDNCEIKSFVAIDEITVESFNKECTVGSGEFHL